MLFGFLIWSLGLSMGSAYLSKNRPDRPRPETGEIIAFNNHGTVTYISRRDDFAYHFGSFAGLLAAFLGGSVYARRVSSNSA